MGLRNAKDGGGPAPDTEVTLATAPYGHAAVGGPPGGAALRLDVALVNALGAEFALDYDIGLLESFFNISFLLDADTNRN